jgi:hypothetical protein
MMIFPRKNFHKLPCLTASTLISILLCGTAAADTIYKTVDAQGNVSFSNTPPPEGVEAQQIELQPGPTPAQQQQSIETEQNLETQSNEIPVENPPAEQQPPVVQPTTEYQQDSDDSDDNGEPVVVDEGYVGDRYQEERLREGVNEGMEGRPVPADVPHPAGRVR